MQVLLEDPETLPFKQGKVISLGILKKEIDRRVTKIKSMLGYNQCGQKNKLIHFGCQTQNVQPNGQVQDSIKQSSVLSSKKSTANLPVQSNHKPGKYAGRCSLPVRKLNDKKNDQNPLSTRVRVSQYLLTAKARDSVPIVQREKNIKQCVQDDKAISNNQFDFFNSFKNSKKKSQLYIERSGYNPMAQPLIFRAPDQNFNLGEFDSGDQDLQYIRSNFTAKKSMSVKKLKFTQRTALQHQKRYTITEETIEKLNSEISKLIVKKRREAQDNKLRQNIFKKIEEKYGEYFDNI